VVPDRSSTSVNEREEILRVPHALGDLLVEHRTFVEISLTELLVRSER
jgi:hypothetical protein